MRHDTYREQLGLHALGALEAPVRRRLEAHVRTCHACRAELDDLRESAGRLGHLAPRTTPSLHADAAILAIPAGGQERARLRRARIVAVAAIAAFFALLWAQVDLRRELEVALADNDRAQKMAKLLSSPDVTIVPLWGGRVNPELHAKLAFDRRSREITLLSSTLPETPSESAYQLWYISERMRPAGLFRAGASAAPFEGAPKKEAAFFALTLEPAEGVVEPTGSMILMSHLLRRLD